ncbi:uncharacterized protein DKFZp434B061-like [Lontra canadensis]|uniref:uncharacterized protein DKFZp434B061-like n=1 Tax=Lontra canadensis TaxID=76717 RepID=UPI0013F39A00|nr:uncharacterized protein DKFZp434B061-like [Lontra canadensis]
MPQSSRAPPSSLRTSRGLGRLCPESLEMFSAGTRPTTTSVCPGRPEWASMCPWYRTPCRTSSVSSGAGGTPLPKGEPALDAREAGVGLWAAEVPRAPRHRGDTGETALSSAEPGTSCTCPPEGRSKSGWTARPIPQHLWKRDKETRRNTHASDTERGRESAEASPPAPHNPLKGESDAETRSRTTPASSPRPPRLPPRRAAAARPGPSRPAAAPARSTSHFSASLGLTRVPPALPLGRSPCLPAHSAHGDGARTPAAQPLSLRRDRAGRYKELFPHIACTLCDWSSRGGEGVAEFLRMRLQVSRDGIFLWKEALLPMDGKPSLGLSLLSASGCAWGSGLHSTVLRTHGYLRSVRD